MSYLVNKTNGELLVTILDGQTDTTHSSLVLIGKQVTGYGELQNENFLHILENFSNVVDPSHPLEGQLWWNSLQNTMNVYDGSAWRPVTGFTSSNVAPISNYIGDQWWDQTNDQYKIYNGTDWVTVGPAWSKLDGKSGALVENVYDTSGNKHTIIKVYHNGNVTAIMSRDGAFTPNVTIDGFTTVRPGISFTSQVDAIKVYGTATNADTLGNLTPSQFVRSDADTVSTGRLSIHNQLDVGQSNQLNLSVDGFGGAVIKNIANNQNLVISANVGGVVTPAITITGTTGLATVKADPTQALGVATKQYVDTSISTTSAGLTSTINQVIVNYQAADANLLSLIQATQANVDITNNLKADKASPTFTGVPAAPTAAFGTSTTQIATTQFVSSAISAFDTTKIYNGTTYAVANSGNIQLVASGALVATVGSGAITLVSTPSQNDNSSKVATTAYADRGDKNYVRNSTKYQPTCYVSDQVPDNNIGSDGDFWFQYS